MQVIENALFRLVTMTTVMVSVSGQSLNDTNNLYQELFSTRQYNKFVRPVENQTDCLQISVQLALMSVSKLDVKDGRLTASGAYSLSWNDHQLSWNASNYGNLTRLPVPTSLIWLPEIGQYSSDITKQISMISAVWLFSSGLVLWMSAGNYETTCETHIFAFPFDTHDCTFNLVPTSNTADEVMLIPVNQRLDVYNIYMNREWHFDAGACTSELIVGFANFSGLGCTIHLRRRPQFLVYHLVVPMMCLIAVTVCVFLVPITSGERLGFTVTLFLAYTVQLAALLEELPRTSINMSFYSQATVAMNVVSALCVVFSVVVTRISVSTKANIPGCLTCIVVACRRRKHQTSTVTPVACSTISETDAIKSAENSNKAENGDALDGGDSDTDRVTWLDVAQTFDCIIFVLVLICVAAGLCAALIMMVPL